MKTRPKSIRQESQSIPFFQFPPPALPLHDTDTVDAPPGLARCDAIANSFRRLSDSSDLKSVKSKKYFDHTHNTWTTNKTTVTGSWDDF
jgi:hypothetical protein